MGEIKKWSLVITDSHPDRRKSITAKTENKQHLSVRSADTAASRVVNTYFRIVGSIQTRSTLVCSSRTIGVEYICTGDCVSLLGLLIRDENM